MHLIITSYEEFNDPSLEFIPTTPRPPGECWNNVWNGAWTPSLRCTPCSRS